MAAALMQQARIAIREGRLVDARRLLRQVIHEEPKNHAAWLLLARTTPDKKLASQYIARAHLLQPDSPLVQRALDDLVANRLQSQSQPYDARIQIESQSLERIYCYSRQYSRIYRTEIFITCIRKPHRPFIE